MIAVTMNNNPFFVAKARKTRVRVFTLISYQNLRGKYLGELMDPFSILLFAGKINTTQNTSRTPIS